MTAIVTEEMTEEMTEETTEIVAVTEEMTDLFGPEQITQMATLVAVKRSK